MMNLEFLQINQISLLVLLVAGLSVIREKNIFSFILVILGSLLMGRVAAVFLAYSIFLYRCLYPHSKAIRVKDAISIFFILLASATPEPYQEFLLTFGVLGLCLNFGSSRLGLVPALLLTHVIFGEQLPKEFVLGGAAGFLVVFELVKLTKTKYERIIQNIFEFPALLLVLFPFQEYILKWWENEPLQWMGGGIALVSLGIFIWIQWKSPNFGQGYAKMQSKALLLLNPSSGWISERQSWIIQDKPLLKSDTGSYFDRLFIGIAVILIGWFGVVFAIHGGFN